MKKRQIVSVFLTLSLVVLTLPVFTKAQQGSGVSKTKPAEQVTSPQGGSGGSVVVVSGQAATSPVFYGDGGTASYVYSVGMNGATVKGQPFSAQAINESIQILSDGNRITRKSTTMIYRDSEGRSRREQTISSVGPFAVAGDPPVTIYISDPVAGVSYTLNSRTKTGTRYTMPKIEQGKAGNVTGQNVTIARTDAAQKAEIEARQKVELEAKLRTASKEQTSVSGNSVVVIDGVATTATYSGTMPKREQKEESLGTQTMEGVQVEGTRHTTIIPAGEIGNELPINVVTEKWYSQELRQVIYLKTTDPRYGETIYRLTNITRTDPDRSLFELPSDYIVSDVKSRVTTTVTDKMKEEQKMKERKPQQ